MYYYFFNYYFIHSILKFNFFTVWKLFTINEKKKKFATAIHNYFKWIQNTKLRLIWEETYSIPTDWTSIYTNTVLKLYLTLKVLK